MSTNASTTGRAPRPILIAGGGIGGLALARALADKGIRCRVLERKPVFSEAGAGIQLGPNGVAVLEAIGAAAVLAPQVGVPDEIVVRDCRRGGVLSRIPLGRTIAERHGAPYWTAHRADLHAALLAGAERHPNISIETGFDVARLEATAEGVRLVSTADKGAAGSAVVGADGLWSIVRPYVGPVTPAVRAGWTAFRTTIPATSVPAGIEANTVGLWLDAKAHVVHYPVRAGAELALVVVLPSSEGGDGWAREADRSALFGAVATFAPALAGLVEAGSYWRCWNLFRAAALPRWSNGAVTLIGDAAHPTLPFLASGGVLALEDAAILAAAVARAPSDLPAAFAAYERQRMGRVRSVVQGATRNGRIYHMSGPGAVARNAVMRVMSAGRLLQSYDWLYGWKPAL